MNTASVNSKLDSEDDPVEPHRRTANPGTWLAMTGVRTYRAVFAGRPSPCRFDPTCSQYALDAYAAFGLVRGTWMAARRIGRCRPGGGQGYDPVPAPVRRARQGKS